MFVCNTHQHVYAEMQPKKNGEYVHLLSRALHEIKRINPCNMHDEFHEYVEGKNGLMETHCRIYRGLYGRFM